MINAPTNHPEDCYCEWCMAAKRARRVRITSEKLTYTFTPSIQELNSRDRVSSTRRKVYKRAVCPKCQKELSTFDDGRFFNHKCSEGKWVTPDGITFDPHDNHNLSH